MQRILIAGAGGVGFWLALALSRLVPHEIVVFDDDDLSGTGATRLPDVRPFGRPLKKKVDLLKFICPGVDVRAEKLTPAAVSPDTIVVDATDMSHADRRALCAAARAAGSKYLRASYDARPDGFVVVVAAGVGFTTNPARGGYTLPPSIAQAMLGGGFAADVISRFLRGEDVVLPARLETE